MPDFEQVKSNVALQVNVYDSQEACVQLLGQRGKKLISTNPAKTIIPLQLVITNNSKTSWKLYEAFISLPFVSSEMVFKRLKYNTIARTLGLLGVGVLATSVVLGTCETLAVYACLGDAALVAMLGITGIAATNGLFIWSVGVMAVEGATSLRANKIMKADLHENMLADCVKIEPGHEAQVVVFVREQLLKNFSITLIDREDRELSFNIDLFREEN